MAIVLLLLFSHLMAGCASHQQTASTTTTKSESESKIANATDTTKVAKFHIDTGTDTVLFSKATLVKEQTNTETTARNVEVEVKLPQENRWRETYDTTSVLETELYSSTATWTNGKLTHTLKVKPGAAVRGTTTVTDTKQTTMTNTERIAETANISRKSSFDSVSAASTSRSDSQSTTKILQQAAPVTRKHHSWVAWAIPTVMIAIALLYFIIRATASKRKD